MPRPKRRDRQRLGAGVVEPGRNLGFGGAINLVAARTRSPWIAAANADVALEPGALDALLAAGGDKRVACVAPRLLLPDGETQHSVYPFPTLAFTAYLNLGLPVLTPGLARWLCLEGFWDPEQPREVPWAIGACLLLRRAAFEEAGAFDEASWMYAEDLDLGWRLRDRGWVTRYEPAARVRHHAAAATAPAFGEERTARFMAATYATIRRRRGGLAAWAVGVANVCGAWVRVAWMAPLSRLRPVPWQHRRNENRRWLRAHRMAVHTPGEVAPGTLISRRDRLCRSPRSDPRMHRAGGSSARGGGTGGKRLRLLRRRPDTRPLRPPSRPSSRGGNADRRANASSRCPAQRARTEAHRFASPAPRPSQTLGLRAWAMS